MAPAGAADSRLTPVRPPRIQENHHETQSIPLDTGSFASRGAAGGLRGKACTPGKYRRPGLCLRCCFRPGRPPGAKKARGRRAAHRTACGRTSGPAGRLGAAGAGRVDGSQCGDAGGQLCPRRPQRKLYPAAGKGRDYRHGDRCFHTEKIPQPADSVRCRDPHRRAECRRCDRLGRGKKSGLEPDKPQRGRQKPLDHLHDGGRLAADAVHRPQKGQ